MMVLIKNTNLESEYKTPQHIAIFFDNASYGIAITKPNGDFVKVNDKFCELLGYEKKYLLNKNFQDITCSECLAADCAALYSLLSGETDHYQLIKDYRNSTGSKVKVKITVYPIFKDDRTVLHLVSIIHPLKLDASNTNIVEEREKNGNTIIRPKFTIAKIFKDNWKWFITVGAAIILSLSNLHADWLNLNYRIDELSRKVLKIEEIEQLLIQKIMLDLNPNNEELKKEISNTIEDKK
jgi:PAS domain S-box-containing protein